MAEHLTPEAAVSVLLREKGQTLAAAESCTGGLIAKRMTDLPGASGVFMGGVVSYTNFVKANVLGVPRVLLDEYGAVSEPVARAMAEGVRRITGADYGISVTGVAGPDSDERGNAVGTVFIGLAGPDGTLCRLCRFGSLTRGSIREKSADAALAMLAEILRK